MLSQQDVKDDQLEVTGDTYMEDTQHIALI